MKNFTYQSILVPYNGSEGAKKGLDAAVGLAKKTKGNIIIITCIENESIFSFFSKNKNQNFDREKKIIEREITKIEEKIESLGIFTRHVILKSSFAAETIIDFAEKNNVEIIILGQTKLEGINKKYHQSMTNYLLNSSSEIPLMIIR